MKRLDYYWYTRSGWLVLLTPLSLVYLLFVLLRRFAYRAGIKRSHRVPVPVIIVGNISVGGTGKTPLVAWLADYLRDRGFRPGLISRGYGGNANDWPQSVCPDSDPARVGDEAVLLATVTRCPMAVAPDRVAAARTLLAQSDCDIIISDDGLQHYALQRDIEIVVIDGARGFGNGFLLPAGPLRESVTRLQQVDLVVVNGPGVAGESRMTMAPGSARSVLNPDRTRSLGDFRGQPVHAVAGIGNPGRFFESLREAGLELEPHPFPDHYQYAPSDIRFGDSRPVVMTEKDAVKCRHFATLDDWFVPVTITLTEKFHTQLDELLDSRLAQSGSARR